MATATLSNIRTVNYLTHHGFSWHKYNTSVWNAAADCLVTSNSIHPPLLDSPPGKLWKQRAERGDYRGFLLETMYPKYHLGNDAELTWAMNNNFRLAVDVSHIYIQIQSGCLFDSVWQRLQQFILAWFLLPKCSLSMFLYHYSYA